MNDVVKQDLGNKYGPDMNWFFDEVLYGSGICDYGVSDISVRQIRGYKGVVIDGDSVKVKKPDKGADTLKLSTVMLERYGEVILPVDVLIHFDNGDEVRERWDGRERTKDYSYEGKSEVQWAKIDPDNHVPLDVNRINNSYTFKPDRKASRRMTDKYIMLMQLLISTFTL